MQLVIIAGGKGTRLKERLVNLPKPMVEIGGRPLLEHQILLARKYGITNILILTGYGAEHIEQYFEDGSRWGLNISYRRESTPLGTAGAVLEAFDQLEDVFILMYGDTMLNVNLRRMAETHSKAAGATLFLHPNDHPQDSDIVELNELNEVIAFHPYPHPSGKYFSNLVNAALYIVTKDSLNSWRSHATTHPYPLDFAKHIFPILITKGVKICGYQSREYIKDAGTPRRLDQVCRDFASGRIQKSSIDNPIPAIFLDRDGTLNDDKRWIHSPDQIELLPGAIEAVREINQSEYLAVVITNQPVVARGECTERKLKKIHNKLEWLLGEGHAFLDGIYYCPHHPDKGFSGERPELKIACSCRKPGTGLFQLATQELNIDVAHSWMIGDSAIDIEAAARFGIPSILVKSNRERNEVPFDCKPDFTFDTILNAVRFVLKKVPAQA